MNRFVCIHLYTVLCLLLIPLNGLADTPGQVINKTCATSTWFESIVPGQAPVCTQPNYTDIAGVLPAPASSVRGGVQSISCGDGEAIGSISTLGVPMCVAAGGTTYYQTVQSNGTSQTQRSNLNFSTNFSLSDSSSPSRTTVNLASTISANLTGNSSTATALASNPTDCSSNQYASSIDASGNLTCAQVAYSQISGTPAPGANQALSNLASTAVNADINPGSDHAINIGNASTEYDEIHAYSINHNQNADKGQPNLNINVAGTGSLYLNSTNGDIHLVAGSTNIDAENSKISQLLNPTNPQDAATKNYVDSQIGGAGTVTSVGLSLPNIFTVTNSPVTTTGSLTGTLASQSQKLFFASPNGTSGAPTFRSIAASDVPTLNQSTTGTAAAWTTARNLAGNSVDGSANATFANKFIVQGTTDTGLSAAQFLGALSTGIVKNTTSTGVLSIATAGDFPTLNQSTSGNAATATALASNPTDCGANNYAISIDASGNLTCATVNYNQLGGVLPNPSAATLGGVQSKAAVTSNWINSISTSGVPSSSQPAFSDISGSISVGQVPTLNQSTTGSAATWTTARNLAGNSVNGSANVPFANAFIVQGTADTGLSGAQFMGSLGTGIVKNTTSTGIMSIATAPDFPTLNQNTSGTAAGLSSTLLVGSGGTGVTSVTSSPTASTFAGWDANRNMSADNHIEGYTTTVTAAGTTTLTVDSNKVNFFTGSTTQIVTMPVTSTLVLGQQYFLENKSSGNVTVNSSGANAIQVMAGNTTLVLTCILTSGTTAASWDFVYKPTAGTQPIIMGGTGVAAVTTTPAATTFAGWDANVNLQANNHLNQFTNTTSAAGTTTLVVGSDQQQVISGATTQTVRLPVATTLSNGLSFTITNLSTGLVTVQTSGANTLNVMASNSVMTATVLSTAGGTGTASWMWTYTPLQNPVANSISSKSANYTAIPSDRTILCDATSGAVTITLYTAAGNSGANLTIKKTDSTFNVCALTGTGLTNNNLSTQGEVVSYTSDNTNWVQVYRNTNLAWVSNTTALPSAGFGTITNRSVLLERDGTNLHMKGTWTNGTIANTSAYISMPTGLTINTSALPALVNGTQVGTVTRLQSGLFAVYDNSVAESPIMFYDGSTNNQIFFTYQAQSGAFTKILANAFVGASENFNFDFSVPVTGWEP